MAKASNEVVLNEEVTNKPPVTATPVQEPLKPVISPTAAVQPQASPVTKPETPVIKPAEVVVTTAPENVKLVKVRGLKEEKSIIAGVVYNIKPKEVIEVPEGVCAIWQYAGVAIKL